MAYKTYGGALAEFTRVANKAMQRAPGYQTTRFFEQRCLAVHRAFDAWSLTSGFSSPEIVREALLKHQKQYQIANPVLDELRKIPPEFCVRGVWRSVLQPMNPSSQESQ